MDKASDILKRVRRIELRARHLATENFAGQYQSGFRGQGLDFDDFREYMPGDDPRFIDWKVTARMNSPLSAVSGRNGNRPSFWRRTSAAPCTTPPPRPASPNWTMRRK